MFFSFLVMFVNSISLVKIRFKHLKCDIILILIFINLIISPSLMNLNILEYEGHDELQYI
jgi:hypothetical protein